MPGNLYRSKFGADLDRNTNELVIRIQPEEAIYLKIMNKVGRGGEVAAPRTHMPRPSSLPH